MSTKQRFKRLPYYKLGQTPEHYPERYPRRYRAVIAKRALIAAYEEAATPEAVTDLLADLRHLCDVLHLDFAQQDKEARDHYVAERRQKH